MIYPLFAMVMMTYAILIVTARTRVKAIRNKEIRYSYFKTMMSDEPVPESIAKTSRHFVNLFETPVLYYMACLVAMIQGINHGLVLWLAWAYVALRLIHAVIHIGYNNVNHRFVAFLASNAVVVMMWVALLLAHSR